VGRTSKAMAANECPLALTTQGRNVASSSAGWRSSGQISLVDDARHRRLAGAATSRMFCRTATTQLLKR